MSARKADALPWFDALAASTAQARELRDGPSLGPEARCLCGSSDTRGRILAKPVDLSDAEVAAMRNEGTRPCRACQHGIHHGAMRVTRYFQATTTVRDHFHPECVEIR